MITSRKSRKTGNTVLMFDYQPDFTVYQAVIELTIDGKSERIPFKCTGRDGQRFMKDIELECTEGPNSANSSVTISYILTTSLTGKTVKVKDTETNLKIISETENSVTLNPVLEKGSKRLKQKSKKFPFRKTTKMSSEEEERLVKEYEQIILNNPEIMQAIDFLAQGSSENEDLDTGDSDTLDPLNLAKQIDDNASDEEISEKLFNLIFNEKSEEDKISECFDKIEELAANCISDTPNIEKNFEKLKQYIFKNTNLIGKMTSDNRDYIRKVIRSIKSLMKTCKNISNKSTRSDALHEFCAKTELGDEAQTIQKFTEKYGIRNISSENVETSENSSDNSKEVENVSSNLEHSEVSSDNSNVSKEVEKVETVQSVENVSSNLEHSEVSSDNSEVSENSEEVSRNSKEIPTNLDYVKTPEHLSENITGFT